MQLRVNVLPHIVNTYILIPTRNIFNFPVYTHNDTILLAHHFLKIFWDDSDFFSINETSLNFYGIIFIRGIVVSILVLLQHTLLH